MFHFAPSQLPKRGGCWPVLRGDGREEAEEKGEVEERTREGEREGGFIYIRTMDRAEKGKEIGSVRYG